MRTFLAGLALLGLLVTSPSQAATAGLFAGSNRAEGATSLEYARDDARRLHEAFLRLGDCAPQDCALLLEPTSGELLAGVERLEARCAEEPPPSLLVVHLASHLRDGALLLGDSRVPWEPLKQRLEALSARCPTVVLLDVSRDETPGELRPVRRPLTVTLAPGKLAVFTSSAPDTASRESRSAAAGTFTAHLLSALSGAGDADGDAAVTLGEAVAFVHRRLFADRPVPQAGASGGTVLTRLGQQGVRFPASLSRGPWILVDERGLVVAELLRSGDSGFLAVPAGKYTVKRQRGERLDLAEVTVKSGQTVELDASRLRDAAQAEDPVKGAQPDRNWYLGIGGGVQSVLGGRFPTVPLLGGELGLQRVFLPGLGVALDVSYGWGGAEAQTDLLGSRPFSYEVVTVGLSATYDFPLDDRWAPFVGLRGAAQFASRSFEDITLPTQRVTTFTPGVVAGLKLRIAGGFGVLVRGRLHLLPGASDNPAATAFVEAQGLVTYAP